MKVFDGPVKKIPVDAVRAALWRRRMAKPDPFKGFHSSPEIIRLAVALDMRIPLSLRNVEGRVANAVEIP